MRTFQTVTGVFERVWLGMGGLCIAVVALFVFADVMGRLILQKSMGWLQTLDQWLVLGGSFLIAGVLLKTGDHIKIDMLPNKLKGVAHKAIMVFNYVVVLAFGIYTTWSATQYVSDLIRKEISRILYSHIPLWTVFIVLPVGMAILALYAAGMIVKTLRSNHTNNEGKE